MAFAACAVILLHPVLARRGRALLWGLAAAFVLLVGFDRIALGVHYVSDVLAGWAVGLATVLATAAMFDRGRVRPLTPDPEHPDPAHPEQTPLSAGPALEPDGPSSATPSAPPSATPAPADERGSTR
jgi:undecaprenyl-diphosphatase